jgi:hypothetical protein
MARDEVLFAHHTFLNSSFAVCRICVGESLVNLMTDDVIGRKSLSSLLDHTFWGLQVEVVIKIGILREE